MRGKHWGKLDAGWRIGRGRTKRMNVMITTRIVYDRKGVTRTDARREAAVSVRVTDGRKSRYVNTGVRVLRNEWRDGEVVNRPDAVILNERVRAVRARVDEMVNAAIAGGHAVDIDALREKVTDGQDERPAMTWMLEQVDVLNVGEGTRKHYRTLLSRLEEWGGLCRWEDVTAAKLYEWDAWLHGLRDDDGENLLCPASVYNYHKNLKALLARAVKFGKIERSPYEAVRGEFRREDKETLEYLTEDEIAAVAGLEFPSGSWAAKARDLFVFQCYTGLAYSDAQAFDIGNYKKDVEQWRAVVPRIKTGVPYVSVLLPPAVEVLERYGMRVPRLSNQKYNQMLKAIGVQAGIAIPLHSHLARHSFATFALKHGVKVENLARMMGHTNIRMTLRYAKVLAESVNEEFERLGAEIAAKKDGHGKGG